MNELPERPPEKLRSRALLFGDKARGGHLQVYQALDYPRITWKIEAETRHAKPVGTYMVDDTKAFDSLQCAWDYMRATQAPTNGG